MNDNQKESGQREKWKKSSFEANLQTAPMRKNEKKKERERGMRERERGKEREREEEREKRQIEMIIQARLSNTFATKPKILKKI